METKHVLGAVALLAAGFFIGQAFIRIGEETSGNALKATVASMSGTKERIEQLERQLATQTDKLRNTIQERDLCTTKFDRQTILYDGTIFESQRWIIPADVTPILIGMEGRASYTRYDPKTQVETVKLKPNSR